MESPIKLSVVISCYKQQDYIAECLESVLGQKVDFEYEIIIADDCSPDNTREVILQFYKRQPKKIKLLFQEKNVGAARNYIDLHNQAVGEYVVHFDGDDIMLPGKLQEQVNVLDADPQCNVVFHRARYFSDDRSYIADTGSLFKEDGTIVISKAELARWGTIAVHSSYAYRRATRKTRKYTQDFMEWFFAFESIQNGGTAAYINKILVEYRCNPLGNAYLASSAGREKAYLIIIRHVIYYFEKERFLRSDLYAHQMINIAMYIKNVKKIKWFMLVFLVKNIFNFNLRKIIETIRVRKMVGPFKKNR